MEIKAGKLVDPCSTQITKTGAWRTFVPVIDHKECIKCNLCEIYCPEGCIHQVPSKDVDALLKYGYNQDQISSLPNDEILFVPDLNYCKGCSVCAHECPRRAIEMVLEVK